MHAYDVPRRQSYQPIPSTRPAQESSGGHSVTPIYDALYAEWVRSYRALPGDRHGEEELGFTAFGFAPYLGGVYGSYGTGAYTGSYGTEPSAYDGRHGTAAYATGRLATQYYGTRREEQSGPAPTSASVWHPVGRMPTGHTGTHHFPAALPPGPRRGH